MHSLKEVWETIDKDFKGKAANKNGGCEYLTSDGKKCAIGLFIPDGHEGRYFDGDSNGLFYEHYDLLDYMPSKNIDLLDSWQIFHDKLDAKTSLKDQKAALFNNFVKLKKEYGE